MTRFGWAISLAAAIIVSSAPAFAEGACPREGTLGVSRTVEIDTTGGPGFGTDHYKAYDFLEPKEVILTFDDGPQKFTTESILKSLDDECVKATFFSVGKMALGYPEIIRDVAKAGHTVGSHTWSHKAIAKLKSFDLAKDEIERGISAVQRAVGSPIAPFFRFPTLVDTPEAVAYLGKRNISMFSCDIDSFDFKRQTPEHLVKRLMDRLEKRGKGILLMHDIHKTTAKAVPLLLAELKAKGYKVVHMKGKAPGTTLAEYDEAISKDAKGLPQGGAEKPLNSIVRTIGAPPPAITGPASGDDATSEPEGLSAEPPAAAPAPAAPAASPAKKSASETPADPVASAAVQPVAPAVSQASEPAASAAQEPAQINTASVVRTVGEGDEQSVSPDLPAHNAEPAAAAPHRSISERVKDTWRLWFGD
ncbi:polysaccharide deacetylase [Hyphomicrobium methylovorum]|uniref:polysaccharide deacetylase family protein n=1 Tax=Hyphomicrobium methylovorum TaxID=84 RepID=UPI0015E6C749|nr:polysaccharide deacetylase family protein [Hyphomicrobium methylovorum]MBA2127099.1 polysaccharide deacetylase [Hyphomicrobium methylovorum]